MQINEVNSAPDYDAGEIRAGTMTSKALLTGKDGRLDNYRVAFTTAETDWAAPRHRHNFDQLRLPVKGEWNYGKDKSLKEGWVGYFPEGVYYGPQLRTPGLQMLVCQFGGASGQGFIGRERRRAGFDALSAKGTFEDGAYVYTDGKGQRHKKDGYEAVWEHLMGRELEYPQPRYEGQIMMNPATCDWIEDKRAPGVGRKWLGTFTERGTRVGFVRLEKGATVQLGGGTVPEFLFVTTGSVSHDGRTYGQYTAFGLEAGETPKTLKGEVAAELFHVQLPQF
jgi:hypothetical protein